MAAKLFSLRNVLDEEADGVRDLLTRHHIDFYETPPSFWGISAPIIWIEDELQLERAKTLLDTFQEELTQRERTAYADRVANNQQPTLLKAILQNPFYAIGMFILAAMIAYFSIMPFITAGS